MYLKRLAWLIALVLWIHLGGAALLAQQASQSGDELKFVLILSRHGIRPPLWPPEQLNQYSSEPWPKWDVPPGYLTARGKTLMKLFGEYDRAYLAKAGLLSPAGCADAGRVYFWADSDQRTLETGRAMAAGMLPGCEVEVHALPEGKADPLFSPIAADVGHPDRAVAAAAVSGRIGGHPEALLEAYRPALETMQYVLSGCKPGAKCPQELKPPKQSLLEIPAAVEAGKGDKLAEMRGPLATAATLAQNFLLEYANGMAEKDIGWGRVNKSNFLQLMGLHTAYADLLRRTPYIARAQASNLLSHIVKAMEQAAGGKAVPGALGKPGDRVVVLLGHDTNISNISGMLGLSWLIEGDQRDDTPPGGALVFELWQRPATAEYTVRTYYMAQTLEQMRKALPVTLNSPPAKAPLFLPACSAANEGFACGWKAFQRTVEAAIDPAFVKP